jgi:hypothetical protein
MVRDFGCRMVRDFGCRIVSDLIQQDFDEGLDQKHRNARVFESGMPCEALN